MNKFVKLGLVLTILSFSMIACVKPISTIGTYKSGDYTMTVDSTGNVYFGYIGDSSKLDVNAVEYSIVSFSAGQLKPWDLGAISTASSYEVKNEGITGSDSSSPFTATTKFKFTTDTQKVSCEVELSGVPEGVGKNGKVTFVK